MKERYINVERLNEYLCHFLKMVENSGIKDGYTEGETYAINAIFNHINNAEQDTIRL